jgi:pimeloyl-ACP methyl ester carboxylesterase
MTDLSAPGPGPGPVPPIRRAYVDLAEGQMHLRQRAGQGTPIIFLHQTASSSAMWESVMRAWPLAHPLHAIDTPGFGGSFDPDGAPDIARYAGWILEAMDGLGLDRAHLVGHHTGAAIALQLAATQADRVASAALIGPAILSPEERAAFARKLGRPFPPVRSGAYLLQNWEYLRMGGADRDVALLHREMQDMLRAWAARPHAYGAVWAMDSGPLYRALACPTTAISARDDLLFPYLERLKAIRPDIVCVTLEEGGNFEPDLATDALVEALVGHVERAEAAMRG